MFTFEEISNLGKEINSIGDCVHLTQVGGDGAGFQAAEAAGISWIILT